MSHIPTTLLLALGLAASPAGASILYVDPAAPGPAHDGTAWDSAFLTIGEALFAAWGGDAVRVAGGTYAEEITLKDGVRLEGGYPGAADPGGARAPRTHISLLLGDGGFIPVVSAPSGVSASAVLDGFEIDANSGMYAILCTGSAPVLSNNVIGQAGSGVNCGGGASPTIRNNIIQSCSYAVYCGATAPDIRGNLLVGNSTGVFARDGATPTLLNNTVAGNTTGISLSRAAPVMANNIVARNGTGIRGAAPALSFNDVSGNDANFDGTADPTGTDGNIGEDPLFANPDAGDYHLRPASPCIDAGDDRPAPASVDLDGKARPLGRHIDMGAYEFDPASVPGPAAALAFAAGMDAATPAERTALDVEAGASAGRIDIADAVRLARNASQ